MSDIKVDDILDLFSAVLSPGTFSGEMEKDCDRGDKATVKPILYRTNCKEFFRAFERPTCKKHFNHTITGVTKRGFVWSREMPDCQNCKEKTGGENGTT